MQFPLCRWVEKKEETKCGGGVFHLRPSIIFFIFFYSKYVVVFILTLYISTFSFPSYLIYVYIDNVMLSIFISNLVTLNII